MTLLKIATIGTPILRERTHEVGPEALRSPQVQTFIDDLVETMRDANGAGLAAPQVYSPLRICALEVENNPRYPYKPTIPLTVLVNPVLTPLSDEMFDNFEGCLSVPDLRGVVPRHARMRLQALDRIGQTIDLEVRGITAGTYQHEIDHLDGKLFVDRVRDPTTFCTWKSFARYHEADFRATVADIVARYGS